jgi:hypothetical protein
VLKTKRILVLFIFLFLFISCRSKKNISETKEKTGAEKVLEFIEFHPELKKDLELWAYLIQKNDRDFVRFISNIYSFKDIYSNQEIKKQINSFKNDLKYKLSEQEYIKFKPNLEQDEFDYFEKLKFREKVQKEEIFLKDARLWIYLIDQNKSDFLKLLSSIEKSKDILEEKDFIKWLDDYKEKLKNTFSEKEKFNFIKELNLKDEI